MRVAGLILAVLAFAAADAFAQGAKAPGPIRAKYSVEVPDAVGDVSPIHTTGRDYPGFDVVKLSLKSDGKRLTVAATLHEPPGDFASGVLNLYIDTDANPATGARFIFPKIGGFEYQADLDACVSYADRSEACAGGSNAKATAHWSAMEVKRYKGTGEFDRDEIVSWSDFPGKKASPRTPITGNVVESTIEYADLHVKPGQTIRLMVREEHGASAPDNGYFPEIFLTLK